MTVYPVYLSRRYRLSASHRLFCPELAERENEALFGKCANPFGHGHNYVIEVRVSGGVDAVTGMVCDLVALDGCVAAQVLEEYDHTNLNQHPDFAGLVPTTENFAIAVERRLAKALPAAIAPACLVAVRIDETGNNSFTYTAAGAEDEAGRWRRFVASEDGHGEARA